MLDLLQKELQNNICLKHKTQIIKFFKTKKGEYAFEDKFLGISTPSLRKLAKKFKHFDLEILAQIISSPYNEERLLALLILIDKYNNSISNEHYKYYNFYINNLRYINNWNLVDISAPNIVGNFLKDKSKDDLIKLIKSNSLWERRIAIIATLRFIKEGKFDWTLKFAEALISDKEDLIHKAVGWMLREIGKKDKFVLIKFIEEFKTQMPRVMLRYAIEKFDLNEKKYFLKTQA